MCEAHNISKQKVSDDGHEGAGLASIFNFGLVFESSRATEESISTKSWVCHTERRECMEPACAYTKGARGVIPAGPRRERTATFRVDGKKNAAAGGRIARRH